jgi:hypothetical protein
MKERRGNSVRALLDCGDFYEARWLRKPPSAVPVILSLQQYHLTTRKYSGGKNI